MAKKNKKFNYDDVFPTRFRELIKYRNVTFDVLAEAFSTTRQTVSNWQAGATVPDAISISMIADYFGVTTDFLLGKTDASTVKMDLRAVAEYTGLDEAAVKFLHEPLKTAKTQSDLNFEKALHDRMSIMIYTGMLEELALRLETFFDAVVDREKRLMMEQRLLSDAQQAGTLNEVVYLSYPEYTVSNGKKEIINFEDLSKFPEQQERFQRFIENFKDINKIADFIVENSSLSERCDLIQFQMQKLLAEEIRLTEKEAITSARKKEGEQSGTDNEENS